MWSVLCPLDALESMPSFVIRNHQSPSPFLQGKPSQFYAKELECFAFYKSLRDHRQIDSHTMCPPWCTTVRAVGHTFAPGIEKFLPKVVMDLKNIVSGETGWD